MNRMHHIRSNLSTRTLKFIIDWFQNIFCGNWHWFELVQFGNGAKTKCGLAKTYQVYHPNFFTTRLFNTASTCRGTCRVRTAQLCVYTYTCVLVHMHIQMPAHRDTCIITHLRESLSLSLLYIVHAHTTIYMHTYIYLYIHIYIFIYTYIYIHICECPKTRLKGFLTWTSERPRHPHPLLRS